MKVITALGVLLFVSTLSISAQGTDLLTGKWEFESTSAKADLDSTSTREDTIAVEIAMEFLKSMTLIFREDDSYRFTTLFKQDQGSWTLNEDRITITSDEGEVTELSIVALAQDRLEIKFSDGDPSFIMKRVPLSPEDTRKEIRKEISTTSTSVEQLSKKWYLHGKESPHNTESQNQAVNDRLKGSYFTFSENGNYEVNIFGLQNSGTWEFWEDKTAIIITLEGEEKRLWSVHRISEHDLILLKGKSEEKWMFSSEE